MEVPFSAEPVNPRKRANVKIIASALMVAVGLLIGFGLMRSLKEPAIISDFGKYRTYEYQVFGATLTTRTVEIPANNVARDMEAELRRLNVPFLPGFKWPDDPNAFISRCIYPKGNWRYDADLKSNLTVKEIEDFYLKALPGSRLETSSPRSVQWAPSKDVIVTIYSQGTALTPGNGEYRLSINRYPGAGSLPPVMPKGGAKP